VILGMLLLGWQFRDQGAGGRRRKAWFLIATYQNGKEAARYKNSGGLPGGTRSFWRKRKKGRCAIVCKTRMFLILGVWEGHIVKFLLVLMTEGRNSFRGFFSNFAMYAKELRGITFLTKANLGDI